MISKFKNLNLLYINSIPTFLQRCAPPHYCGVCCTICMYYSWTLLWSNNLKSRATNMKINPMYNHRQEEVFQLISFFYCSHIHELIKQTELHQLHTRLPLSEISHNSDNLEA